MNFADYHKTLFKIVKQVIIGLLVLLCREGYLVGRVILRGLISGLVIVGGGGVGGGDGGKFGSRWAFSSSLPRPSNFFASSGPTRAA